MKLIHKKSLFIKGMIALCIMIVGNANAQVNYVLNPSLEELYDCPQIGQLYKAKHWFNPINGGTPDLMHTCNNNNIIGVPKNILVVNNDSMFSYQQPKSGHSYGLIALITLYANVSNFREYTKVKLASPLQPNKQYCVRYYVSLANFSRYGIDEIGAYFNDDGELPINSIGNGNVANVNPQVRSLIGVPITDTLSWQAIQGIFMANGTEEYLMIGNYKDDANTNFIDFNPEIIPISSWYYLDDVSVIPSDLPAYAGEDTVISPGDSVFIGRQPEIGLECEWHSNGQPIGTVAGIWVKPTQTTSYIVTQDLCGNIQQDTVIVYVFPTSVQVPLYLQSVQLFPNPAHHMITLSLPQAQGQHFVLQLFSPEGKKVWQGATQSEETDIPLPAESGVYFLEIRDAATGGRVVKKVVRE